jgi:hypothetical protein
MKSLILIACFLPVVIIYIVMKLSVWIAAVNSENDYVREDSKREHGPYLADAYADVDEEKENY